MTQISGGQPQSSFSSLSSLSLKARRLYIDTRKHLVAVVRGDCSLCRSAGLRSEARINIRNGAHPVIATLYVVNSPIVEKGEIGLSESAWEKLGINEEEDDVIVTLAEPLDSFGYVRAKLHGKTLTYSEFKLLMQDMIEQRYSDIQLSAFITACVNLDQEETISMTRAMSETGYQLKWTHYPIVDKHCIGGVPGNRTTMIIVPILAAYGLIIPKTSSRAITSPAGTADTMEVLAPVNLELNQMKKVVEKEGGCIVWGGAVDLSPVDDILVQVERSLDLDSKNQLVASVLSKKIAAGSTHVLIDIPTGPTAKIRSQKELHVLKSLFSKVGESLGIQVQIVETDGNQPIGRGIGPVLEARDILSILRNEKEAPQDLKERGLFLAGHILEACTDIFPGQGILEARQILEDGRALRKFEAICQAQGGLKEIKYARFKQEIHASREGMILRLDNRLIARLAKLAGAPDSKAAGVDLNVRLGALIKKGDLLFTIYAESEGELNYALHYYFTHQNAIVIGERSA